MLWEILNETNQEAENSVSKFKCLRENLNENAKNIYYPNKFIHYLLLLLLQNLHFLF